MCIICAVGLVMSVDSEPMLTCVCMYVSPFIATVIYVNAICTCISVCKINAMGGVMYYNYHLN